jgi:hypothetical protein
MRFGLRVLTTLDSNHVSFRRVGTATLLYLSSERPADDSFGMAMDFGTLPRFRNSKNVKIKAAASGYGVGPQYLPSPTGRARRGLGGVHHDV